MLDPNSKTVVSDLATMSIVGLGDEMAQVAALEKKSQELAASFTPTSKEEQKQEAELFRLFRQYNQTLDQLTAAKNRLKLVVAENTDLKKQLSQSLSSGQKATSEAAASASESSALVSELEEKLARRESKLSELEAEVTRLKSLEVQLLEDLATARKERDEEIESRTRYTVGTEALRHELEAAKEEAEKSKRAEQEAVASSESITKRLKSMQQTMAAEQSRHATELEHFEQKFAAIKVNCDRARSEASQYQEKYNKALASNRSLKELLQSTLQAAEDFADRLGEFQEDQTISMAFKTIKRKINAAMG